MVTGGRKWQKMAEHIPIDISMARDYQWHAVAPWSTVVPWLAVAV